MRQQLTILGATGSSGTSTLEVVALHPERYGVYALTAQRNLKKLAGQAVRFRPLVVVVGADSQIDPLRQELALMDPRYTPEILAGTAALEQVAAASTVTTVMAAIVGAAGLASTLAAARAGKKLLLANKESLVMSGRVLMEAVAQGGALLLPVDSEHNAVFQCWPQDGVARKGVSKILLTASGGPFLQTPLHELETVTPDEACNHPKWRMGRKISVDSATMMNKGLELIEACWLFDLPPERVDIVIHPQSLVHSLVAYEDGSLLAQLGHTDMRVPIAHALAYPERHTSGVPILDLTTVGTLQFVAPDRVRFPALALAEHAMGQGGTAPTVLNAANEVAVAAFLEGQLGFRQIPELIEAALSEVSSSSSATLEEVLWADRTARHQAAEWLKNRRP
ncbi:MAG: 1-deoxy-D-xylulose-5-phosphate reductoisomerase [Ferrovum sp.]|nr:1-deoxy-D-xylulose-5-phosphate reductoisomerase [Ferrovum sp.]